MPQIQPWQPQKTLIKSVANPLWLSLQYGLQTAGGKTERNGCVCVCQCVCLIVCVCVHRAIDVQREAERSRCKEERVKDRWAGGGNMRDGEGNWKIGSWDGKKCWTGEQTQGKVTSDVQEVLSEEKRVRWKMAGMIVRKEERPKSAGVTCIVDGCDNGGVGREEKSWGLTFFFCLPLFSAGSQQVWVWTAGERIDVGFYSQNTLLHLWQPPWWRDRPMGWRWRMEAAKTRE